VHRRESRLFWLVKGATKAQAKRIKLIADSSKLWLLKMMEMAL